MTTSKINEASVHMQTAYKLLVEEGCGEKYFPLAVDVGQRHWGRFFGKFGDPNGLLIEIKKGGVPNEITVSVVIRRQQTSIWSRIKEIWGDGWAVLRNKETRYTIRLADDQLTKFKDLLRNL